MSRVIKYIVILIISALVVKCMDTFFADDHVYHSSVEFLPECDYGAERIVDEEKATAFPTGQMTEEGCKVYSGRLISVDLDDTDVDNGLRIMAQVGVLNLISGTPPAKTITMKLKDEPWDKVFDHLMQMLGGRAHGMGKFVLLGEDSDKFERWPRCVEIRERDEVFFDDVNDDGCEIYSGKLISVDVDETSLDSFFGILSKVSGLNMVVGGDIGSSKITLRLIQLPWEQIFDIALMTNGLSARPIGDVVVVGKPSEYVMQVPKCFSFEENPDLVNEFPRGKSGDDGCWQFSGSAGSVECKEMELGEIVATLGKAAGADFRLSKRVDPTEKVNLKLSNVPIDQIVYHFTRSYNLEIEKKDGYFSFYRMYP